jgi:hypothetical protein
MRHPRDEELARRQQELLVRSATLRVILGQQARVLQTPLGLADQVRGGVQWLRKHPLWPLASVLLIALTRPRSSMRWASRLWMVRDLYRQVRRLVFSRKAQAANAHQTAASGQPDQS